MTHTLYRSITLESVLQSSGKICVALFAFVSGFGLFFSLKKDARGKSCLHRCAKLYLNFWIVLGVVFVPLFICFGNKLSMKMWIRNLLGLESTLNKFDWYVPFYAVIVVLLYSYVRWFEKRKVSSVIIILVIIGFPLLTIGKDAWYVNYLVYSPVVFWGYLCAKCCLIDQILSRLQCLVKRVALQRFMGAMMMSFVILWRHLVYLVTHWKIYNQFDWLLAFIFVLGVVLCFQRLPKKIYCVTGWLGKRSTNMWYLHAVFFGSYIRLQWIAYWPKISFLVVLWAYLLLMIPAWLLSELQKYIENLTFNKNNRSVIRIFRGKIGV